MKINFKLFLFFIFLIKNIYAVPFEACFKQASKKYNVPIELLVVIASVESNYNKKAININKNGSMDMGIMQINSVWLPKLNNMGVTKEILFENACQNIMIGVWILAQNISIYGFTWEAIQRYNGSDTQKKYATKIYKQTIKIYPQFKSESFGSKIEIISKSQNNHFLYIK